MIYKKANLLVTIGIETMGLKCIILNYLNQVGISCRKLFSSTVFLSYCNSQIVKIREERMPELNSKSH